MVRKKKKPIALVVVAVAVLILGVIAAVLLMRRDGGTVSRTHREADLPPKTEAPPDIAKFRDQFASGLEAMERKDGADAVKHFGAIDFGSRAVEDYRLYYLARGHELAGDANNARATLARLSVRRPKMVHAAEAQTKLGDLYAASGAWNRSAASYRAAGARWQAARSSFYAGDLAAAIASARELVIDTPRAPQADDALGLLRAIGGEPIRFTHAERLQRSVNLMRDGDNASALRELEALAGDAPPAFQQVVQLNRGIALHRLRRFEDSNRLLEPLASGPYKYAIPALYHASKNYRIVSSSIDPTVYKTIVEKKQVGKVKVRVGKGKKRKTVTKPKFANVKKTIKLIDLGRKTKKDSYDRLATERLKDLLQLPASKEVRVEVLNTLINIAAAKGQTEYVRELVPQAVKADPISDPGLQFLWDKAWAAYARGDLAGAKSQMRFIADTYTHPNVKRQAEYWYARSIDRAGSKGEAAAIYQKLANAPYEDVYAIHAVNRGAKKQEMKTDPLKMERPEWSGIAEKNMPAELRLAYELTALSDVKDAHLEIRRNGTLDNRRYSEALLADLYNVSGNKLEMYRSLRRAFPQIATVEQDSVPTYFLSMYYPRRYHDAIREHSKKHALDPHLVMALILQESYYNPRARSHVGATGLMQIMPPTGRELAQRMGRSFSVAKLEDPEYNITLGTAHLKMLINLFGGNTYMAVASYNAGQGNVMKWKRGAPGKPLDEFLESIPFPETRNYVKRVTMLRSSYKRIAG